MAIFESFILECIEWMRSFRMLKNHSKGNNILSVITTHLLPNLEIYTFIEPHFLTPFETPKNWTKETKFIIILSLGKKWNGIICWQNRVQKKIVNYLLSNRSLWFFFIDVTSVWIFRFFRFRQKKWVLMFLNINNKKECKIFFYIFFIWKCAWSFAFVDALQNYLHGSWHDWKHLKASDRTGEITKQSNFDSKQKIHANNTHTHTKAQRESGREKKEEKTP